MLIEFTVGNYLSFKDKKTLSLEATSIKEGIENVIEVGKYKLLRSAVIYGANSSGKSNLIKALNKMCEIVETSAKNNSTTDIDVTPFLLNSDSEKEPSFFEILFLVKGIRYRYGFEVDKKIIHAEWLFEKKVNTEKQLFIRNREGIEITSEFREGENIEEKTRENALFISVVDQFNGTISKKIIGWMGEHKIFSGISHENEKGLSSLITEDELLNHHIKDFLTPLGLGFTEFKMKKKNIVTFHNKFDSEGNIVGKQEFDLINQESSGTNKLYDIAGNIILGLLLGRLVVIDELDAKLHPLLTMAIVKLFNSPIHNPRNSQLVFATHDTNLLNYGCFRRDQIYFTEKNNVESTDLYSLVEYIEPNGKKVRKDRSFEPDYIAGRYGGIPFIGDFSKLIDYGTSSKN